MNKTHDQILELEHSIIETNQLKSIILVTYFM